MGSTTDRSSDTTRATAAAEPRDDEAPLAVPPTPRATPPAPAGATLTRYAPWLVVAALVLGVLVSAARFGAPAVVLFLAFAALAGAILLFWESARAVLDPNAPGDEVALEGAGQVPSDLEARKRAALRALKDIEFEHSIHRLSDEDFATLRERYRAEARAAMQAIDKSLAGYLPRAEALIARAARGEALDLDAADDAAPAPARAKKNRRKAKPDEAASSGATVRVATSSEAAAPATTTTATTTAAEADERADEPSAAPAVGEARAAMAVAAPVTDAAKPAPSAEQASAAPAAATERRACAACGTSNEPDATFCKRCGAKVGEG